MTVWWRLFVMMVLQVAIWGAWQPKIFPYMTMLGFNPGQQGLVGTSWAVASVLGIFFSNQFADRNFAAEKFLAVSHAIGGICLLGTAYSTSFIPFFLSYLAFSLLYVPTLSVANSLAFANLPNPARQFGSVRMGGTIGWILASWPFTLLLSARASIEEVRSIFLVAAIISFAMAFYSLTLPRTPPRSDGEIDRLAWRGAFLKLRTPFIAVLFLVTFIDAVVHNGYFVMADAFLTERVGIAGNLSMIVLSVGQVAEILTMLVLGTVLARLGWRKTLIIGLLGHAARFLVFAFMPDSIPIIVAVQLLHGICYAFFFATVYIFVDEAFPGDVRSSAQGLFNLSILGVGMVVASYLFPWLMSVLTVDTPHGPVTDFQTVFLIPSGMALAGAVILAAAFRPPSDRPSQSHGDVVPAS